VSSYQFESPSITGDEIWADCHSSKNSFTEIMKAEFSVTKCLSNFELSYNFLKNEIFWII